MIKLKKKGRYYSNVTDEMRIRWYKTSPLKKMQWLEEMRLFYKRGAAKKTQKK